MVPFQHGDMAVGLFDLLGFKALLREHEHRLVELYETVNSTVTKAVGDVQHLRQYIGSSELGRAMFSDTLFLWIPATSDYGATECVERMCVIASSLLSTFMQAGMPLRGAIAYGVCLASVEPSDAAQTLPSTTLLGVPVVEAHELERAQEWAGVALCTSAGTNLESSEKWPEALRPFVRYEVPLKRSRPGCQQMKAEMAIRYWPYTRCGDLQSLMPRPREGPGWPSAERKRNETIRFYEHCLGGV